MSLNDAFPPCAPFFLREKWNPPFPHCSPTSRASPLPLAPASPPCLFKRGPPSPSGGSGRQPPPAPEIGRNIRPDGTLPFIFDGVRVLVPLPPLAGAILAQIDGVHCVGDIRAALAARGTDPAAFDRAAFDRAWGLTYAALSSVNRILLAAPV